jgi:hypothetical protein
LKLSSFFDYQGPGRISIARYAPRGTPAGFRQYKPLAPGPWFNKVEKGEYEKLYFAELAKLDPHQVVRDLEQLAAGAEPTLLCWERKAQILAGKTWCHRHMVAQWFKTTIGLIVEEL